MRWKILNKSISEKELALWLHLTNIPGIGPVKGAKILQHAPVTQISPQLLNDAGWSQHQIDCWSNFSSEQYQSVLKWADSDNHHILYLDHPAYPALLRNTVGAPLILFVIGDPELLNHQQIAMVGSRHPSSDGRSAAKSFTRELVQHGLVNTSGLASGIDAICHQEALSAGGKTIAVQGCGLAHIYPAKHKLLAAQILEQGGALVSEFLPQTLPRAEHFPRRNRIISGLSLGALIIEAAEKSGSLITARYALEQNREVFAVPGSINNINARGCHRLIQQGAKLVCDVADIIEELGVRPQNVVYHEEMSPDAKIDSSDLPFSRLLDNVRSDEVTTIDVIAATCGLPVQEVMTELIMLELNGLILSVPGGYVRTRSA